MTGIERILLKFKKHPPTPTLSLCAFAHEIHKMTFGSHFKSLDVSKRPVKRRQVSEPLAFGVFKLSPITAVPMKVPDILFILHPPRNTFLLLMIGEVKCQL